MRRYRENNHDIIFEDWWTCNICKAKGPQLNNITCINHVAGKRGPGNEEDDDEDNHKRRNTGLTE
eukprot:11981254-Heterocapsa_arctica.AAC.1